MRLYDAPSAARIVAPINVPYFWDKEEVLRLGVRYGYLFQGVIGRKEGAGRAALYILSRRLAPLFNLDPMGFSAYKFLKNDSILTLMNDPEGARLLLRRNRGRIDEKQITIDFPEGDQDA